MVWKWLLSGQNMQPCNCPIKHYKQSCRWSLTATGQQPPACIRWQWITLKQPTQNYNSPCPLCSACCAWHWNTGASGEDWAFVWHWDLETDDCHTVHRPLYPSADLERQTVRSAEQPHAVCHSLMHSQTVHLATPCLLLLHGIVNSHVLLYFIKFRLRVTLIATKCISYIRNI